MALTSTNFQNSCFHQKNLFRVSGFSTKVNFNEYSDFFHRSRRRRWRRRRRRSRSQECFTTNSDQTAAYFWLTWGTLRSHLRPREFKLCFVSLRCREEKEKEKLHRSFVLQWKKIGNNNLSISHLNYSSRLTRGRQNFRWKSSFELWCQICELLQSCEINFLHKSLIVYQLKP